MGEETRRHSGLGSGVVVSSDGYILTNYHVVEAADEIEVALNSGKKYKARVVGADPESDIAVLRIDADEKIRRLAFKMALEKTAYLQQLRQAFERLDQAHDGKTIHREKAAATGGLHAWTANAFEHTLGKTLLDSHHEGGAKNIS